ncbi:MAG: DNA polymerase III subunit chi [Pseudomonadota bacterium]
MAEVLFYHLENTTLDTVLPGLLEKSLARGWRSIVRAAHEETLTHLDALLWSYKDDSFLPHAVGDDETDTDFVKRQPIWLSTGFGRPNDAEVLFVVGGGALVTEEIGAYQRCVVIFDGVDGEALTTARALWKEIAASGHDRTYWRREPGGGWKKQA